MIKKTVGVLGSGQVGKTLAGGFILNGYDVMLGTGHPANLGEWITEFPECQIGSFAEAVSFGQILVLAVKGLVANDLVASLDTDLLSGKTIIDVTNPIADSPPVNNVLSFFTGPNQSLMETLQHTASNANFVKAFSCVSSLVMVDPEFDEQPTMFICGNHGGAKIEVRNILRQFGWQVADMGGVEAARAIEPLALLTCIEGFARGNWTTAYRYMR